MTALTVLPGAAALPPWALPAGGLVAVAILAMVAWAATRHARLGTADADAAREAAEQATLRRWRASATFLTIVAAIVATATALNGMWHVFGDALGLDWPARLILVGFLEIPLVTSAIRARVAILEGRPAGGDGAAMWVLALVSAGLSAADAATWLARALRFVVPLVAAWMWDGSLAADRHRTQPALDQHGQPVAAEGIAWRWSPRRLAVRLGLADPTHRPSSDVDRARRLARLTRARLRLAVLSPPMPWPLAWLTLRPVRRAVAGWRLQRQALAAVEYLRLGTDPAVTATITTTVAAVVGLADATDPSTLTSHRANPWTRPEHATGSSDRAAGNSGPAIAASRSATERTTDRIATPSDAAAPGRPIDDPPDSHGAALDPSAAASTATADAGPIAHPPPPSQGSQADRPTARVSTRSNADDAVQRTAARPDDVARLRDAIASGDLPPAPPVDAVRRHLQISPNYARAARAAVQEQQGTEPPDQPGAHTTAAAENTAREEAENGPSNSQSGIEEVTTRAVLIQYPAEKAQESIQRHGTNAVRLP